MSRSINIVYISSCGMQRNVHMVAGEVTNGEAACACCNMLGIFAQSSLNLILSLSAETGTGGLGMWRI